MDSVYLLSDDPPSLDDYLSLRAESGLTPRTPEQGAPALTSSWAWATVRERITDRSVAMGRVIGDGGWYFVLADMATLPAHQKRGLGRAILRQLLERIDDQAPPGAYVTLMADGPGRPLYVSEGFVPTAPRSIGMVLDHARRDASGTEPFGHIVR